MFFWATHGGAEIDLVVRRGGDIYGFEFKVTEKPSTTRSITIAKTELGLKKVYLVYPGELTFPLAERVEALGYSQIPGLVL